MKDTVRILAFILGASILSKVPGLRQPKAVLFWLIRVILEVLKFLAFIGVAAVVLIVGMAVLDEWRNRREGREAKKNSRIGGGLGYAR
jgi:ABC-type protease/lipase transport system fused ATPase/permease subunit